MSANGFHNFWVLFCKQIQKKVLLTFLKFLPNCENPSSNPLQEACFGFPIATYASKRF
jgi:hypothetical protein